MKTPAFSTCAVLAAAVSNGVSAINLDVNSSGTYILVPKKTNVNTNTS